MKEQKDKLAEQEKAGEIDYTQIRDDAVRGIICKYMSEMLDNPDTSGIYPTSRFMWKMEKYICDIIDRQSEKIETLIADIAAAQNTVVAQAEQVQVMALEAKAKDDVLRMVLRTRDLVLPQKGHLVKAEHREEVAALTKMFTVVEQAQKG